MPLRLFIELALLSAVCVATTGCISRLVVENQDHVAGPVDITLDAGPAVSVSPGHKLRLRAPRGFHRVAISRGDPPSIDDWEFYLERKASITVIPRAPERRGQ